ncbi:MAG: hypothetical protein K0B02_02550 [DPANN group archaeon]|nr:hypothetical protein [DPANN group archaeon]
MSVENQMYIKCKCGNTFRLDNPKMEKIFVVDGSMISQIKYTFDYVCPKCGKENHATGYFS